MVRDIIIKPVITEKAEKLSKARNQYTFVVKRDANKVEIQKAITSIYNVAVESVNTMVIPGKSVIRNTKKNMLRGNSSCMPVKKLKPVTPGTRFRVANTFQELTTDTPEKSLLSSKSSTGGRNNQGHRTTRYRGGGHKKKYRIIDFFRDKDGIPATVKTIEYDPNRSAYIALLWYVDGEKRYIIAPNGLKVGTQIVSGPGSAPETGNCLPLSEVPLGSSIHSIELHPGQGAAMVRSAGTAATMMGKEDRYAVIKMPSGEIRRILSTCRATIGSTSNTSLNHQTKP